MSWGIIFYLVLSISTTIWQYKRLKRWRFAFYEPRKTILYTVLAFPIPWLTWFMWWINSDRIKVHVDMDQAISQNIKNMIPSDDVQSAFDVMDAVLKYFMYLQEAKETGELKEGEFEEVVRYLKDLQENEGRDKRIEDVLKQLEDSQEERDDHKDEV